MTAFARAVLRAAVGHGGYAQLEAICEALSELELGAVISSTGSDRVLDALAEELVARAALRETTAQMETT